MSVILDVYDDPQQEILKSAGLAKLADRLVAADELGTVPDHLFALVMVPQSTQPQIRKYACVDLPNTLASAVYLSHCWENLPPQAAKVAAANIRTALGWYGQEVPQQLQQLEQKLADMFPGVPLSKTAMEKLASGQLWPYVDVGSPQLRRPIFQIVGSEKRDALQKLASAGASDINLEEPDGLEKAAEFYRRRRGTMDKWQRVEFCRKLYKYAQVTGRLDQLPDDIVKTATVKLADGAGLLFGLTTRHGSLRGDKFFAYMATLREKLASFEIGDDEDPLEVGKKLASLIEEHDRAFGVDPKRAMDPADFVLVPDRPKAASYKWHGPAGMKVSGEDLVRWSNEKVASLAANFSNRVVTQFVRQPVEYFDQLPDQLKIAIAQVCSRDDG